MLERIYFEHKREKRRAMLRDLWWVVANGLAAACVVDLAIHIFLLK